MAQERLEALQKAFELLQVPTSPQHLKALEYEVITLLLGIVHYRMTLWTRCLENLKEHFRDRNEENLRTFLNDNREIRRMVEDAYKQVRKEFEQRRREIEEQQRSLSDQVFLVHVKTLLSHLLSKNKGTQQEQERLSRHQEDQAMETESAEGDLGAQCLDENQRVGGVHEVRPSDQQETTSSLVQLMQGLLLEQGVDPPQMETAQQQGAVAGPETEKQLLQEIGEELQTLFQLSDCIAEYGKDCFPFSK